MQYFGSDCNRLQPKVKYCNKLQDFYEVWIRMDSNRENVAIYCNILHVTATDCNRLKKLQYIATFSQFEFIRIDKTEVCIMLQKCLGSHFEKL